MKSFLFIVLLLWVSYPPFHQARAQVFQHISEKDGAPKSTVLSITQDRQGFIWYTTSAGLFRYDSRVFKSYRHNADHPESISSNYLSCVFSDSQGNLWIGADNGLNRYDPGSDSFIRFGHNPLDKNSISADNIYCLAEDKQGKLWIGSSKGSNCVITQGVKTRFTRFLQTERGAIDIKVQGIAFGEQNELWLATSEGLVHLQDGKTAFFKAETDFRLSAVNDFASIYRDGAGNIWLGLKEGGLMRFDITTHRFEFLDSFKSKNDDWPLVKAFQPDKNGKLWIATWTGLVCFDLRNRKVDWYVNERANPRSLAGDRLLSLFQDIEGGLWIGSRNMGIDYLSMQSPGFSSGPFYIGVSGNSQFLDGWAGITPKQKIWLIAQGKRQILLHDRSTGVTPKHSLELGLAPTANHYYYLDGNDLIWYGGGQGLYSYNFKSGNRQQYWFPTQKRSPPKKGRIHRIIEDWKGRLWLCGSFGVLIFDKRVKAFQKTAVSGDIRSVFEDSKGNVWCGGIGVAWLIQKGANVPKRIFLGKKAFGDAPAQDTAYRITEDFTGRIWLTCAAGLRLYDPRSDKFLPYPKYNIPMLSELKDIQADKKGYLWLSREFDLVRYHPDNGSIESYGWLQGLPRNGLLGSNSAFADNGGMLYFNTNKELFCFNPAKVSTDTKRSPIVVTALKLINREVRAGDQTGILTQAKQLVFRASQNVFTLKFVLLSFAKPGETQYLYKLEGFEKNWNSVSTPFATYSNLPAGNYTFYVKAAQGGSSWAKGPLRLRIRVLPPWWQTWYAYFGYILFAVGAICLSIRFFWLRASLKKENELYEAKLDFFANISHDVRTHLSLIDGPLEKAFGLLGDNQAAKHHLSYAKNNSERLLNLLNELLDFRKIENGGTQLAVHEYDLVKTVKNILSSFEHVAAEKGINTRFLHPDQAVKVWFDLTQMQKVFYNLLANAFKFTPEKGWVSIEITPSPNDVVFSVTNSGRGIAPKDLSRLFDRFFQIHHHNAPLGGHGIGLTLSKAIVDLHQAKLAVTSQYHREGQDGQTSFTVRFLLGTNHYTSGQFATNKTFLPSSFQFATTKADGIEPAARIHKKYTVLLIEDNDEFRTFESEILSETYHVLNAANGSEGLKKAFEHVPDLILCDVMMPGQNGIHVCSQLKDDVRTSHIPIILLTAQSELSQMIEGLRAGADDYLVKPFDLNILLLKVNNLLRTREKFQRSTGKALSLGADEWLVADTKDEFVNKVHSLVIENISQTDFGVNEMAFQTGVSVSVLYRKLRSLTGMTVNEFMKTIKMQKALQLLESGNYQVGEVALMVGYEDLRHFSIEFKKIYGKTPSQSRGQSVK